VSDRFSLGAPGVYFGMPEPIRALTGVRMDVCAFVGVAPRGPARVPIVDEDWPLARTLSTPGGPVANSVAIAVESFDEYRARFGAFEGPGLLPYAVAQFFAQGGRRAYIVRVVHAYGDERDQPAGVLLTTGGGTGVSVRVDEVSDFSTTWAAAPPARVPVSAANPVPIAFGGVAANVIAAAADAGTSGPGTLTLAAPVPLFAAGVLVMRADRGAAAGALPGVKTRTGSTPVILHARDEGTWGNALRATIAYETRPVTFTAPASATVLAVAPEAWVPIGSLVRLTMPSGPQQLRFVSDSRKTGRAGGATQRSLTLDQPTTGGTAVALEVIEATLHVEHGADSEQHTLLGLSPQHPRWLATVLASESRLLYPDLAWADRDLALTDERFLTVPEPATPQFMGGTDRYAELTPRDFFDDAWTPGDETAGKQGVHALTQLEDLSLLVVPDLYSPAPLPEFASVLSQPVGAPRFVPCVEAPPPPRQAPRTVSLDGLQLDPTLPADLARIIGYQSKLVELAETLRSFIVLLDVPPKLHQQQILRWRGNFSSAFAAAYHPWLTITRPDDAREALVRVNPSATAAGIIARQEILFGVQNGPANALAADVVSVDEAVSPQRHAELHQSAINVYLREPLGIRLTAARTLSNDRDWRQLNVRRLVTMLARALERQCQWAVFEPNNGVLMGQLRRSIRGLLQKLYRANAFTGTSEDQAFFVRCDAKLNDRVTTDAGRVIAEIGVAPAEPLEFLVVRLQRDDDNTLSVVEA
jgi:Bacteriophage tail sheath protein